MICLVPGGLFYLKCDTRYSFGRKEFMRHAMKKSVHLRYSILNLIWFALIVSCCAVFFFTALSASALPVKTSLFFYSSESTINNFKSLKMEFDRYLTKYGSYEFQPFSDRETFEKQVKQTGQCILLLSSWHYNKIYKEYGLKALLVGTRNGKKYEERILVTSDETLKAGSIASASSIQHTDSCLQTMIKDKSAVTITNILTVPKDIDALMSVGFGMSKFALTTQNTFKELKSANPMLYQKLKVLAKGEEALLPVIAVPEAFMQNAQSLVRIIQDMAADPNGKEKLQMIELDGWQALDASDRVKLEAK